MKIEIKSIGYVYTDVADIPRHWTLSDAEGIINIDKENIAGLRGIKTGQRIVVIFLFHKSPVFTPDFYLQFPRHHKEKMGVFSICTPVRPNPIGMSVLEVLEINGDKIHVKGIDMLNGTPVLDIKPYIESKIDCPDKDIKHDRNNNSRT